VADVVADVESRLAGREGAWGIEPGAFAPVSGFVAAHRDPATLAALCGEQGPRHLEEEFEMAREAFHRFAANEIRPVAEHVHRENADIPESIIQGVAQLGGFGLSVPEEYGGSATGGESDYLAMVVATEELAWGSSGWGAPSSPGPRSSPGRWSTAAPRRRSGGGSPGWPAAR
jgi:(2S)-methylsuccinyl-CoA dehydrogenase